jgi:aromatic-L-amino-acid decarboxylase
MKNTTKTINTLKRALEHAENHLSNLDTRPVSTPIELDELKHRLDVGLNESGIEPQLVIDELVAATKDGLLGCAGGRFFAWVIGGALPSALAADWLTSTWDQNAALYATGPSVSVIEEIAGEWLKSLLDLPTGASVAFTTGCQMAHFTGLAAARFSVLQNKNWDVNRDGLTGAPPIRVFTSKHRHGSIDRVVRFLGIGTNNLINLETDTDERITCESLEKALNQHKGPAILVLDAADLNVAAFDPFEKLIPIAKNKGVWVHIDGAFGLFARASKTKKPFTKGIELADSWATDGHKWLNVPFDCGMAFVRDRDAHRHSMTITASYIEAEGTARDQIDWNPEWSRRARGVSVYAALRELGRSGVERLIDDSCEYCLRIVKGIGNIEGAEVLWQPTLNQGLVRFCNMQRNASEEDHDRRTERVIRLINETGEVFFSGTTWKGRKAMRVSVVNWMTDENDVSKSVQAVAKVLKPLSKYDAEQNAVLDSCSATLHKNQ